MDHLANVQAKNRPWEVKYLSFFLHPALPSGTACLPNVGLPFVNIAAIVRHVRAPLGLPLLKIGARS